MTKTDGLEVRGLRVTAEARAQQTAPEDSRALSPSVPLPVEEITPLAHHIILQIRNFRSPPTVG